MAAKRLVSSLLLVALLAAPVGALAQTSPQEVVPEFLEKVAGVGEDILRSIPGIFAGIWQEQAVPIVTALWNTIGKPVIGWFADLIQFEERKETVKEEFEKEKQELKESAAEEVQEAGRSLWDRFKALLD